ncbi:MAG: carbohydrate-binding domain-containing protein, partial [Faecousia sp.]
MKRRILAIALTLCMLLSLLPVSALAAETNYDLYINNFQFSSSKLTYTSGSGSATYDPNSKTLTIKNLTISTEDVNTLIESGISGLTIKIDGTLTLNLLASKVVDGVDYGKIRTNYGIAVTADTTICGANNSADKDSIIITSQSTGVDDTEYDDGTTRVGIRPISGAKLTVKNLTVSMTDNSTGSYAGHASMIRAVSALNISGCKLVTDKCQFGVFVDAYVPVTITDTVFDMNLNGTLSSGVNFAPNAVNVMQNCSGSISGEYPVYTAGQLTISGGSKLTLTASKRGIISGQNQDQTPGKLTLDNVNLEIQSEELAISAELGGSITMKSGTVNVTKATYGLQVAEDSSFAMQGGTLSIRGADTTNCLGIKNSGTVTISGGSLKTENVYSAIQHDSSTALSITGGEHTLTAATCGYLGGTSAELKISNTAKVTINAETGIQLPASSNTKLTVSGGELNINATNRGIELVDSTSAMTLSGGKVNITDKNSTPTIYGIYSRGNTQLTGAEVTFKNCSRDLLIANSSSKMTGGKLHLSGYYFGAQLTFNFEMTGGVIDGSTGAFGFVVTQGTTSFKGGTVDLTANYPFYLTNGATVDFAGANVTGNATANCGLYVTDATEDSYKISGGTVVLTSTQAGANEMYTSIPSNYGVWAGENEAGATLVDTPTQAILATSKYVRFAEKTAMTLTLVNVKEGTSASYFPGESFTYTAKDAPSGKHFSHWELTVGSTTTTVGTDTTYSGRMPAGNATLTAVYENCSGGTATCKQKAVCATCGKEYGELAAHDFTAEVAEAKYLKTEATCTEAAVYYKSCTVCGESSEGTAFEATFSHGEAKGHAWGDWTSNGDGTHSRTCGNDAKHTEKEDCSGGTATCQQKAVCDFCYAEYGELAAHSYTAEVAEDAYLKDAATCTEAAVYYKSCAVCGESSEGTAFEATFSHGEAKGHAWGDWASNGDGTHSRTCGNDKDHKE